jgi:peptidoglycan/LPS O-acetylase OafA/YrhL
VQTEVTVGNAPPVESATAHAREIGPDRPYFAAFEGLRALAALLVVLDHTGFASGFTNRHSFGDITARGEIGVAVFFLISGFLLYRPFVAGHLRGEAGPHVRTFLIRRAMRIIPLYWVVLTVVMLSGTSGLHSGWDVLAAYGFAQVYVTKAVLHGVTQAWSLDVEVVFYLTLPLWAAFLARGMGRRSRGAQLRTELGALAVLYAVGVLFRWYVVAHPHDLTHNWHGWMPQWFDMFAVGMALAVISAWYAEERRRPAWVTLPGTALASWVLAGVSYWLVSKHVVSSHDPLYVGSAAGEVSRYFLYGLFGFFLLLPAVFTPPRDRSQGPIRWLLTCRPLAFLGLVSYGIYLWHQWVVTELLKHTSWRLFDIPYPQFVIVVVALTAAIAGLTYAAIERPGISLGRQLTRRWRARSAAGLRQT